MPELINQLDPAPKVEFVSASNNAAWSAGEIALHYGAGAWPLYKNKPPLSLVYRSRLPAMGPAAHSASHSYPLEPSKPQEFVRKCSSDYWEDWPSASGSRCPTSGVLCCSMVPGPC